MTLSHDFQHCTCPCTWIEENDCSKAAQLCLVHLHVSHFTNKLCQNPEERTRDMQREKSQMETVGKSREREGEKIERIVPVKNKKRGGIDKNRRKYMRKGQY